MSGKNSLRCITLVPSEAALCASRWVHWAPHYDLPEFILISFLYQPSLSGIWKRPNDIFQKSLTSEELVFAHYVTSGYSL
jgi:hypothetical protein